MGVICLHDKTDIESFFLRDRELNIYAIGDLDDFFWPNTLWYAEKKGGTLKSVALLYTGQSPPTLLALSRNPTNMQTLLESVTHLLPCRFYAHLSPDLETTFQKEYRTKQLGTYFKMILKTDAAVNPAPAADVVLLSYSELDEIKSLFLESYPENWFNPKMLETKQYFGIRKKNRLYAIAGIHVYSEKYRVAALGNITTHPDFRNQGLGTLLTMHLCHSLRQTVDHIGLNVKVTNNAAISCYKKIGFEIIASFGEFLFTRTRLPG